MSNTLDPEAEELLENTAGLSLSGKHESTMTSTSKITTPARIDDVEHNSHSQNACTPLELCEIYLQTGEEDVGALIVKSLTSSRLTVEEAFSIMRCLTGDIQRLPLCNDIFAAVLKQESGQKATVVVADKDEQQLELIMRALCKCNGSALIVLTTIVTDGKHWVGNGQHRITTLSKLSGMLLFALREADFSSTSPILKCLTKIITTDPGAVVKEIQSESFQAILASLRPEAPVENRTQAIVIVAKYIELAPEEGKKLLTDFVSFRVSKQTTEDLITAFSVAAAVFPILPSISAGLFLTENFVDNLETIFKRSKDVNLKYAVLNLLSAACMDSSCRASIVKKCSMWLSRFVTSADEETASLAALVLIKAGGVGNADGRQTSESTDGDQSPVNLLKRALLNPDEDIIQNAVEGLAFASIKAEVKQDLATDVSFLKKIYTIMEDANTRNATLYGSWTIVSNLTTYPPTMSAEQKRLARLKAYANHTTPSQENGFDQDEIVTDRCNKLLATGLVHVLVRCSKTALSSIVALIASITLSLTKYPKNRGLLVQQGLLITMIRYSNIDADQESPVQLARRQCTIALARTLISLNPALVFNKLPVDSVIRPLTSLLEPPKETDSVLSTEEGRDIEPIFDCLRAMTNLASMDERTRILIADSAFSLMISYLWSSNTAVIQAATECVLNLTVSYAAASKFFLTASSNRPKTVNNIPGASPPTTISPINTKAFLKHNNILHLVVALTHSSSPGTRRAATATLAHILAWGDGVISFLALNKGVETLISVITEAVNEGDFEWLVRGTMAILLLLTTEMETIQGKEPNTEMEAINGSEEAIRRVKKANGKEIFTAMKSSDLGQHEEISEMIDGILTELNK